MQKNNIKFILVFSLIGSIAIISLVSLTYKNLQKSNPQGLEDVIEKRQQIKVPPIETTEVIKESQQENNQENNNENTEIKKEKVFEQEIQVEPTTPEYTQVDNLQKILSVEEPTTSVDMKIPEIIHDELTTETTTKK